MGIVNDEVNSWPYVAVVYGAVESWSATEQPAGANRASGFSRVVVLTVNQNHPILAMLLELRVE